ncbi:MAG: DEAD/DEAH box helicase [Treponema sp.]|jgi:superfamily II DNA/RNA helicase|nr:DEAD/DEAH box helicase [Treponema sp.]
MSKTIHERTGNDPASDPVSAAKSFTALGAAPRFVERLAARNITVPTAVQSLVIPRLLGGENVFFRSATGTGKTFAYLIPLFQRFMERAGEPDGFSDGKSGRNPAMLCCAPTYELCAQIRGEAEFLLEGSGIRTALLIGQANTDRQIEELKKRPQVIVGNPGRILQLARMGKLKLGDVRFLVLDEGDRLTADETLEETRAALSFLVSRERRFPRQIASCSATLPSKNRERLLALAAPLAAPLADADNGGGVIILESEDQEILREWIQHWALFSESRRKISALRSFLAAVQPRKALIFLDRGGQVGNIVSQLQYHGIGTGGLYGDMDKKERKRALEDFRRDRIRALVTSDLAARGLDIPEISHVIALDTPHTGDAYIHRAGRTGRAGKKGVMVTIEDEQGLRRLAVLEKKLGIVVYPKILREGRLDSPPPL